MRRTRTSLAARRCWAHGARSRSAPCERRATTAVCGAERRGACEAFAWPRESHATAQPPRLTEVLPASPRAQRQERRQESEERQLWCARRSHALRRLRRTRDVLSRMTPPCTPTLRCAESMGLLPPLFNALRRKGFRIPTPVQRKAIPLVLAGALHGPVANHHVQPDGCAGAQATTWSPWRALGAARRPRFCCRCFTGCAATAR